MFKNSQKNENKNLLEPLQTIFFQILGKGTQYILSFMIHTTLWFSKMDHNLDLNVSNQQCITGVEIKVYLTNH